MKAQHKKKMYQALIDLGHMVETKEAAPTISALKETWINFLLAEAQGNNKQKKKATDKLISDLIKWEIENL